jgi:hypothetical protein
MASYAYTFTSGDTVTPTKLNNARTVSDIVNADVSATAAIAGTKIAPNFGSQAIVTTGTLTTGAATSSTLSLTTGSNPLYVANSSEPYIEVRDTTATTRSFVQAANGVGGIGTISNHPLRISTNNTERMRIDASGNVVIGTTTASDKLHVAGSTSTYIRVTSSNASTGAGARFINATSTWLIGAGPTSGGSEFAITDSTSGTNERLRIDANGNVGIGTTTPATRFHVLGASIAVRLESSNNFNVVAVAVNGTIGGYIGANGTNLIFSDTAGNERMRIDSSGNVGIGTSSPLHKLDVRALSNEVMFSVQESDSGNNRRVRIANSSTVNTIESTAGIGSTQLAFAVDAAERMRIDSSGNVGINDTAPAYHLDVNGDANVTGVWRVDDTQVVTNRRTGWAAPTGTATRTTFATSTVTTAQLAERVKALIDDLTTHGLIGA